MAQIYLTYFWNTDKQAGEPVKAYVKEADAKAAAERSSAARKRFKELWSQLVEPYACSYISGSRKEETHPFPSKDGKFYSSKKAALYGDKQVEFYALEEVKECRRLNTMEDYYEPIELCE